MEAKTMEIQKHDPKDTKKGGMSYS